MLESDAIKHDVQLKVELGKIPDLFLDEKEIRQIVYNLIRNALEATPAGSIIIIRTFLDPEAVVLAVQDQGPGIDPKILDKIGTPFLLQKTMEPAWAWQSATVLPTGIMLLLK